MYKWQNLSLAFVILLSLFACSRNKDLILATAGDISPLPHSEKGFELYSWQTNDEWYFTLITGTNRLKTIDEITSTDQIIANEGWIKIRVAGVEKIKNVLSKLPKGEAIMWVNPEMWKRFRGVSGPFSLPPKAIVTEIQDHCTELGLELQGTNLE